MTMLTIDQQAQTKRWLVPGGTWAHLIGPDHAFERLVYGQGGYTGPERGTWVQHSGDRNRGATVTRGYGADTTTLFHLPYRDARAHRAALPADLIAAIDQTYTDAQAAHDARDTRIYWPDMPDHLRAELDAVRRAEWAVIDVIHARRAELLADTLTAADYEMDLLDFAEATA